jgi:hypothetical protein
MVRSQAITVFPLVCGDRRMRIRGADFRRARGRCRGQIGVLKMQDDAGGDEETIAVPVPKLGGATPASRNTRGCRRSQSGRSRQVGQG